MLKIQVSWDVTPCGLVKSDITQHQQSEPYYIK